MNGALPIVCVIWRVICYTNTVDSSTMAINELRNRRNGPGGGTRHLHHHFFYGGEIGSTCAIKASFLLGIVPPLWAKKIDANSNKMRLVAANSNSSFGNVAYAAAA